MIGAERDLRPAAKHRVIAETLASRIRRGAYRAKIPGERALADEFGVNFKTANRAVGLLVDRGLVERRRGEGTFVVKDTPTERTRLALAFYKYSPASPDPIYAELFASANSAAKAAGCSLELTMPGLEPAPEGLSPEEAAACRRTRFVDEIAAGGPEGILYCGNAESELVAELESLSPVLQVSAFGRDGESFVRRDPADGVARAVRSLAESGRTKIAFATYEINVRERHEKLLGYERATEELGLDFDRRIVTRYPARPTVAAELLDGGAPADAVVCAESTIGRAVTAGLADRGARLPADVALWSFDDGLAGVYTIPRMSGIRVYDAELGARAVGTLVRMIEGTVSRPVRETLPAILVPRESSGSASEE